MTKKDYKAIADTLMRSRKIITGPEQDVLYAEIVNRFCDTLAAENKLFDTGKFIAACYPVPGYNPLVK